MSSGITQNWRAGIISTLAGHALKAVFFDSSSNASKESSTTYAALTHELTGGGYTAGGYALTATASTTTEPPYIDFADLDITDLTVTAWAGIAIVDTTDSNKIVAVYTFDPQTFTSRNITVRFPPAAVGSAIIRLIG